MKKHSLNWTHPKTVLQKTCVRYFDLRQATWQPTTLRTRWYVVFHFISFIEKRYKTVRTWSDLKRHPHVEAWLQHIGKKNLAVRHNSIQITHKFLNDMIDWDWPDPPPTRLLLDIDLPRLPQQYPKPLDQDTDRRLQQVLEIDDSIRGLALRVLRKTGLRVGELLNMPPDAVRQNREGRYELRVPPRKTYTERIFPLTDKTQHLFDQIIKRRGIYASPRDLPPFLLVHENGRRINYAVLQRYLKRVAKTTNIHNWHKIHLHQFRHTFATELARADIPLPSLMRLLGHRQPDMTMKYVELSTNDIRNTYETALAKLPALANITNVLRITHNSQASTPADDLEALILRLNADQLANPAKSQSISRLVKHLRSILSDLRESL